MVRKSLSETLSAQAREFLEDGKPQRAKKQPLPEPARQSPLSGVDWVLAGDFWTSEDRVLIKKGLFERYRRQLERSGHQVTQHGILNQRGSPNTRALDKEIRELKREVAVLADVMRIVLKQVVDVGGKTPEDLRDLLMGRRKKVQKAKAPAATEEGVRGEPEEPTVEAVEDEAAEAEAVEVETAAVEEAKVVEKAVEPATETNGTTSNDPEPTSAESVAETDEESEDFVSQFRRGAADEPAGGFSAFRRSPETAEEADDGEATSHVEKPRERVPRRDLLKDRLRQPAKVKICPRCQREVSVLAVRCLSCGKTF